MANPSVEFDLNLKSEKAMAGLKKYGNSITQFAKRGAARLKKVALQFAKVALAAGAMGLAIGVAVVKSQLALMDATAKTSDVLGIEIERLQELRHAANLTGVANEQLDAAIEKMVVNITDAAVATSKATGALVTLRLKAVDLARMSPHEMFLAIAEAMGALDDSGKKVLATMDIFGKSATGLVNTLALGSAGLREAGKEAQRLGLFTREMAAGAESANDAIDNMTKAAVGFGSAAAADLAPYIEILAKDLTDALTGAKDATDGLTESTGGLTSAFGIIADSLVNLIILYKKVRLEALLWWADIVEGPGDLLHTAERGREELNRGLLNKGAGAPGAFMEANREKSEARKRANRAQTELDELLVEKTPFERGKILRDARARKRKSQAEAKEAQAADTAGIEDLGFGLALSATQQAEERTKRRMEATADERKRRTERLASEKAFTSVLPPRTEEFPGLIRPEVPLPVVPADLFEKKKKEEAEEAGGFQDTFESLQGLQRRISAAAASSPEERAAKAGERAAKAGERTATGIDKLVVIAEKADRDLNVGVFGQ